MDKKQTPILLIGGKGCSVSEGMLKCLRHAEFNDITLLEYSENAAHIYRVNNYIIIDKNPNDGEEFIDGIIKICKERKIKAVLPGSTWEARVISEFKHKLIGENIMPLVNNLNTILIGDDKWKTYQYSLEHNINTPLTFLDINDALENPKMEFPMIVKPRQGRGSQNIFIAKTKEELEVICNYFVIKKIIYLIQEFIGRDDHEYTVGVISDKNGKVIQSIVMRRLLLGGATGYAEVCERSFINDFSEEVARKVKSTGPINVQLRLNDKNEPMLFEINPRFSGSAPMRTLAGFNEPEMILSNFLYNEDIKQQDISYNRKYFRVFQEIEIPSESKKGNVNSLL